MSLPPPASPGLTRTGRLQTATYFAAFVGLGLVIASLGPTLPGLTQQTGATVASISFLFVARSLGHLLGSFFCGGIYDRVKGHPLLAGTLLLLAMAMAVIPFVPMLVPLIAVFLVLGVAEGTIDVGGNSMLLWVHKDRVGPFMNALHFSFGLGAFIAPLIVAQVLLHTSGIAWAYWIIAAAILPVPVVLLFLPSPERRTDTATSSTHSVAWGPFALLACVFFLYTGAEASYGGWIASYAIAQGLGTEAESAYLTSGIWGAICLGRLLAIPLAYRIPSQTMLIAGFATAFLMLLLLLLVPLSLPLLWAGTIVVGLAFAPAFPMLVSYAEKRLRLSGKVAGWLFASASAGGMFWPWFVGQRFESAGPDSMLRIIFLCATAALILLIYNAWQTRSATGAKAEPSL